MTPKDKAEELIKNFTAPTRFWDEDDGWTDHLQSAKECALTAVDEMILIVEGYEMALRPDQRSYQLEYYQEVKQEIEKL